MVERYEWKEKNIFFLQIFAVISTDNRLKKLPPERGIFKINSLSAARRYEKHRDFTPKSAVHLPVKTAD
jgi:GH25 family lysozyme M1 (1,4-beta-N-acetylmuramidase)